MHLTQAWHLLTDVTPPELTHYYQNDHPGASWWLKCAVPDVLVDILTYWHRMHTHMPDLVHVRASAWDWQGNLIPDCHSVWIREHADVILHDQPYLHHEVTTYQEGMSRFMDQVKSHEPESSDIHTWQDVNHALHLMNTHVSDREARMRRQSFRVIHGKKTTSHKRARSNLDSE
jgi:hypothetical protein